MYLITWIVLILYSLGVVTAVELTFELPDNARQCFHEDIQQGVKSTVEFQITEYGCEDKGDEYLHQVKKDHVENQMNDNGVQVVTGGHYDVDATIEAPSGQMLFHATKQQSDSYSWIAEQTGIYKLCFSNEFSTFSHKLVYFDFVVGEEKPLPGIGEHLTAMTKLETSSSNVHEHLNTIIDYQTHHRLMEAQGRKRAEDLNSRVLYWSLGETLLILVIAVGQVMVLRNFFSEKKGTHS